MFYNTNFPVEKFRTFDGTNLKIINGKSIFHDRVIEYQELETSKVSGHVLEDRDNGFHGFVALYKSKSQDVIIIRDTNYYNKRESCVESLDRLVSLLSCFESHYYGDIHSHDLTVWMMFITHYFPFYTYECVEGRDREDWVERPVHIIESISLSNNPPLQTLPDMIMLKGDTPSQDSNTISFPEIGSKGILIEIENEGWKYELQYGYTAKEKTVFKRDAVCCTRQECIEELQAVASLIQYCEVVFNRSPGSALFKIWFDYVTITIPELIMNSEPLSPQQSAILRFFESNNVDQLLNK